MTSIEKLKEKCDNYLDTRVYKYIKAKKRKKLSYVIEKNGKYLKLN